MKDDTSFTVTPGEPVPANRFGTTSWRVFNLLMAAFSEYRAATGALTHIDPSGQGLKDTHRALFQDVLPDAGKLDTSTSTLVSKLVRHLQPKPDRHDFDEQVIAYGITPPAAVFATDNFFTAGTDIAGWFMLDRIAADLGSPLHWDRVPPDGWRNSVVVASIQHDERPLRGAILTATAKPMPNIDFSDPYSTLFAFQQQPIAPSDLDEDPPEPDIQPWEPRGQTLNFGP